MWETSTSAASFHARLNVAPCEYPATKCPLTVRSAACSRRGSGRAAVLALRSPDSPQSLANSSQISSQIPQYGGGLLVQRQKRAGKPKPDRDDQGGRDDARGAAGLPDKAQRHQPRHDQPGRDRARDDAENGGGEPDQQIFQRIGAKQPHAGSAEGFQDDGVIDPVAMARGKRAAQNQ